MPAIGRFSGTPASISASEVPHTVAIDDEPFELGDLRDDADGVGELFRLRQHRMDRAPGELAVADLAAAGRADAAGLADRERREVVVQQERFLVGALQRVDELLVLAGAERGDDQRLRLAAGEQRRAVGARQHADFRHDRAHGVEVAAVDALAGVEDVPAHDLGFEFLEHAGDALLVVGGLGAFREEVRHHLRFGGGDGVVALHFLRDRIGRAQVLLDQRQHRLLERGIVRHDELARLLGGLLGELDDGLDHRLEMPVAEHHGAEHDLLGQLLGFRFHHQHRVGGAGDDEVELALDHLVELRVEHVFVVDEADAGAADRAHEGRAGERQRGGGRDHGDDVGIVLQVVRQHGDDDLRLAAPAIGEQRTDRAVDQARGQRVLFGRPAFALEIAAGNAAGRVIFFRVVDGQREEVDAFLRRLGGDDGGEHGGLAVGGEDGAVGLAGDLAGLEGELAPAPIEFNTMDIEHFFFLSWFSAGPESHEQDGEKLPRVTVEAGRRTASGDPAMAFRTLALSRDRTFAGPACRRRRLRRRINSECVSRIRSRNARGIRARADTN